MPCLEVVESKNEHVQPEVVRICRRLPNPDSNRVIKAHLHTEPHPHRFHLELCFDVVSASPALSISRRFPTPLEPSPSCREAVVSRQSSKMPSIIVDREMFLLPGLSVNKEDCATRRVGERACFSTVLDQSSSLSQQIYKQASSQPRISPGASWLPGNPL